MLHQVLHSDVARLEAHQQLLSLRSGDQLQVKRVARQEAGDTRRHYRGPRRGSHLGAPGMASLASCHLIQDLLLCRGIGGKRGGQRRGTQHTWTKWGTLK